MTVTRDLIADSKHPVTELVRGVCHLLVIAIDQYHYQPLLRNCVKDATDIIEILTRDYGFARDNVKELYNERATTENILVALDEYAGKLGENDSLLVLFSGHGQVRNSIGFWVPVDAVKFVDYLPVSTVRDYLEPINARHIFVIADACFAGSFFVPTKSVTDWSAFTEKHPSRYALTAARDGPASDGQPGNNSPFAQALKSRLGSNNGSLGAVMLSEHVVQDVVRVGEGFQIPRHGELNVKGNQHGQFFFHRMDADASWCPYSIPWPDDSSMLVLPVRAWNGLAFCISAHPISNAQYRHLVVSRGDMAPSGERWIRDPGSSRQGRWQGPFTPWEDGDYNADDQPVVCVSLEDAYRYCERVNELCANEGFRIATTLPSAELWDFAAFGTVYPSRDPATWMAQTAEIHHRSAFPAPRHGSQRRTNRLGVVDMIGNVWEWCNEEENTVTLAAWSDHAALRGGSFLDDLVRVVPFLDTRVLREGMRTKHADLGFRIAGVVEVSELPREVRARLAAAEPLSLMHTLHRGDPEWAPLFRQFVHGASARE